MADRRRRRRTSGHIRRLSSGRYQAQVRDPITGRQVSIGTFATKADADAALAVTGVDQRRGDWVDPRRGEVLFADWVEQWWATTADRRPSTRARDRNHLDKHVIPMFGPRTLGSIRQIEVQAWVSSLPLSPTTVRRVHQLLAQPMAAAVNGELIARTPCRNVRLPQAHPTKMRFLSEDEVSRLAAAIDPRYRALVLVAAYGGLRLCELVGLRPERVDILRGAVEVAEDGVEVKGTVHFGPPKTKASSRRVRLPRFVAEELAAHLAAQPGPFVFSAPGGGPLRAATWRTRFWGPAVRTAGLAPLTPHGLRHTAISIWAAHGLDLKACSERAGHTSVAFTQDRYRHLFQGHDDDALERLDARGREAEERARNAVRAVGGGVVVPLNRNR